MFIRGEIIKIRDKKLFIEIQKQISLYYLLIDWSIVIFSRMTIKKTFYVELPTSVFLKFKMILIVEKMSCKASEMLLSLSQIIW